MKMKINDLSRDELRNLMKPLSIEALRAPVKENAKLEKKYITGFRASSVTYIQLVKLYFQEIHSANSDVERVLLSSVNTYLEERNLREQIESLAESQDWSECVQMGISLGTSMCEIDFTIIVKLFEIEMPDEKIKTITLICNQLYEQHKSISNSTNGYEKEKHDLEKQIEKLDREKSNLEDKKNAAIKQREDTERQLRKSNDQVTKSQLELEEKNTYICEKETEITKHLAVINGQEQSLKEYRERIGDRDLEIKDLKKKIIEINRELAEISNDKIQEYNVAIDKLVIETIEDLKVNYNLDAQQFDEIISSIEGEHDILTIWNRLSDINASSVADIEAAMRSNIVTTDVIDKCDDVENNILVKYIILKAIKSLYFEYLSRNEEKENLSDMLFKN